MEDGRRRVVSLQEVNGMEGDIITTTELFAFERRGIDAEGNVLGELKLHRHRAWRSCSDLRSARHRSADRSVRSDTSGR